MECDFTDTYLCGLCDYSSKVATIITRSTQKCDKITFHFYSVVISLRWRYTFMLLMIFIAVANVGGMGPTASVVFKRIASMIADKTSQSYTTTIRLIRCKLTFSLLHSTITYACVDPDHCQEMNTI